MNALDLLKNDHQRLLNLLQQLENELDPATGRSSAETLGDFSRAFGNHQKMEGEILFPELEKSEALRAPIASSYQDARRIGELITSLEENRPAEAGWHERLSELRQAIESHVEQIESRVFPEVEKLLGATRLQEMFYEMEEIRTHQSELDSAIYPASRLGPKTT
jgi:hemerythrin superfamily protein